MKPINSKKSNIPQRQSQPTNIPLNKQQQQSKDTKESFLRKVAFCSNIFDFKDENKNIDEKTNRLKYLQELSEMLTVQNNVINMVIPNLDNVMEMIQKNLFRPLPIVKKAGPAEDMAG